jgi:hypothetical protein
MLPKCRLSALAGRFSLAPMIIIASLAFCVLYPAINSLRTRRVPAPVSRSRARSVMRYPFYTVLYMLWYFASADFLRATAAA